MNVEFMVALLTELETLAAQKNSKIYVMSGEKVNF